MSTKMNDLPFLLNPAFEHTLPSGLMVKTKAMDGFCEDMLANRKKILKDKDAFDIILAHCIEELEGVSGNVQVKDVLNMWSGDRMFALLKIRQQSLGNEHKVKITCPNCEAVNSWTVDIEEDIVKKTKIFNKENKEEFATKREVDIHGTKFIIKLSDGNMENLIVERNKADEGSSAITHLIMVRTEGFVDENGKTRPLTKAMVSKMNTRYLDPLRKAITEFEFGPDVSLEGNCSNCGGKIYGSIVDANFFLSVTP